MVKTKLLCVLWLILCCKGWVSGAILDRKNGDSGQFGGWLRGGAKQTNYEDYRK